MCYNVFYALLSRNISEYFKYVCVTTYFMHLWAEIFLDIALCVCSALQIKIIIIIISHTPGAQPPGAQSKEDGTYQLSKRGRVHGVHLLLLAVAQVVVVEGAARQTHALRRLVVVYQPLHLQAANHTHRHMTCLSTNDWLPMQKYTT